MVWVENMNFFKKNKAQGALEYLLIIGGAILLAAIVIAVLINMTTKSKTTANDQFDNFNNVLNSTDLNVTTTDTTNNTNTNPVVTEDQILLENAAMIAFGKALIESNINTLSTTILATYTKYKSDIPTIENNFKDLTNKPFDEKYILNYSGNFAKYWFLAGSFETAKNTYDLEKMKTCLTNNNIEPCYTLNTDYINVGKLNLNFN